MSLTAEKIGALAQAALVKEARLTPKPGLVDAQNNGAHTDMDLALLLTSATVLEPYFARFAEQGISNAALPPDGMLSSIRAEGRKAEEAMLKTTNGVNTHKGALFLLGALCYGAGYCAGNGIALLAQTVCQTASRVCAGVTGELGAGAGRAYLRYGASGARGEAEAGFPHALLAIDAFQDAIARGAIEDDAWLFALLRLIETLDDANVLARCGKERAQELKSRAGEIATRYPNGGEAFLREMRALDCDCQAWRASPGGAADLLATAMFLAEIVPKKHGGAPFDCVSNQL